MRIRPRLFSILLGLGLVAALAAAAPTQATGSETVAEVACFLFGCEEDCAGDDGEDCRLFEKCSNGSCSPTVQQKTCKPNS